MGHCCDPWSTRIINSISIFRWDVRYDFDTVLYSCHICLLVKLVYHDCDLAQPSGWLGRKVFLVSQTSAIIFVPGEMFAVIELMGKTLSSPQVSSFCLRYVRFLYIWLSWILSLHTQCSWRIQGIVIWHKCWEIAPNFHQMSVWLHDPSLEKTY